MKKHPIITILAVAFAFVIPAMATPEEKPWREIATGTQTAIEKPERLVIRTPEAWREWWKEHTKNEFDPANPNAAPKVDFDKEMILVATMGMRSSGGFSIRFSEMKTEGGTLMVVVTSTSPGPDDTVTMALTYPFAIIAVPKHDGEVVFSDG
jgi:hypothetical protein